MTHFEIQALIQHKRWTELLRSLEPGENDLFFPSVEAIKSCKAVAYDINSSNTGRKYYFHVDKAESRVTITVNEN